MRLRQNFKPFKLFWIDCQFNTLVSMLISVEPSYQPAPLLNSYSYLVGEEQTPNMTKYNYLCVKPTAQYWDKYKKVLYAQRKPLDFKDKLHCVDIVKRLVKRNKVVVVGVDLFYWIPNSICWKKHHWTHYSFVNGFDNKKRVFYVFDESFSGYNEFEIPEDRFITAIMNCQDSPHGYMFKLAKRIEKFQFNFSEVKENAKRIVDEINKIIPLTLWELSEEDFNGGHMCDLLSTQIFQIINRQIANQLLFEELDEVLSLPVRSVLSQYCRELQEEWTLVKNKLVRIYFSDNRESLICDINKACTSLLLKEIDMWKMLLNNTE